MMAGNSRVENGAEKSNRLFCGGYDAVAIGHGRFAALAAFLAHDSASIGVRYPR
jgi:hypothetical protein